MNRRQLIMFSGAAMAANEIAQAQSAPSISSDTIRTLIRYSRARATYKIPKSEDKGTKYVGSLSAALELSIGQRQEAAQIFNAATAERATLRAQFKTARQSLRQAIYNNDTNAISQATTAMGGAKAQLVAAGASAHAAFFRLLTFDQQAKLLRYRS